ncbi:TPA: hypothetical protein OOF39_000595 [Kluyvera ascorbata]|uniref:Uncharacterized protein n=1 Tax=Kluyvera genomosp. 3 TaxID=2774055 RepID=A0A248KIZ8_9ENTR|nr:MULTISPECIES: hypothetical protein [Kluyvera]ASG63332.1 hypothetical protein CEW81_11210 [Kluyvera genomosp. 3]QIR27242.1 hypothetical protein GY169_10710 [Kluyvera genomosp. 3]UAK19267.1 hypothetical protein K7B04_18380 [Kluyvera sp. CRP]HCR3981179.1 hypothetical protein [Kluyvera ascorbata]HDT6544564.1 hypothetical protein [Kluyvera ascorbata]
MKNIKIASAAILLSTLSFGVFAAEPATQPASSTKAATVQHVGISSAYDVEAGSNIAPGSQNTGRSMDDAFNVHTLVAGEWY